MHSIVRVVMIVKMVVRPIEDDVVESTIRGHHKSKYIWTPTVGKILIVSFEPSNPNDGYAAALQTNDGRVVGHVPKELFRTMLSIMTDGLEITCSTNERWPCCWSCAQRTTQNNGIYYDRWIRKGLEVPCLYKCIGNEKKKIKAMNYVLEKIFDFALLKRVNSFACC